MANIIKPQKGPQEMFVSSSADIVIYGGAAGGGKTYALLLDILRDVGVPGFTAAVFRREYTQVTAPGGLWDSSLAIYGRYRGAVPLRTPKLHWRFPSGATVSFGHIAKDSECEAWQGSQICRLCFDELTHFCLTPDTEVLTAGGWKPVAAVATGETVPSLAPDGSIVMKPVLDTPSFDFDGMMTEVDQKHGISACMTPEHRVPAVPRRGGGSWRFVRADELASGKYRVLRTGDWKGGEPVRTLHLDVPAGRGLGKHGNSAEQVDMNDWLAFLGWYLAEGSAFMVRRPGGGASPCVSVRQTKRNGALRELMNRLPWRVSSDGDGGYRIWSRQLYDIVKPLGNQHVRRIPRYVFSLPREQQQILLDAFVDGDGHRDAAGGIQINLCSEKLIDDLQELFFYAGRCSARGMHATKDGFRVHTLYVSRGRKQTAVRKGQVRQVPYTGKVFCLTVADTHTFLIRRKGKIHWTGNSEHIFFYMLSRNRSACGVKPCVRCTCNPDADSWVADFISWWIDPDTGYPIAERSGKARWMLRVGETVNWFDTRAAAETAALEAGFSRAEAAAMPKSVAFIASTIEDNQVLLKVDPSYLANLRALPVVERERLLYGNWKIKPAAGLFFKRTDLGEILAEPPKDVQFWVRCWDLAASEKNGNNDPAFTAGVLMGKRKNGRYVVADVINRQMSAGDVRKTVRLTAQSDRARFRKVRIRLPQDPGQAGKEQAQSYIKFLSGFDVCTVSETGSKEARASPMAAQWQAGNFDMVAGPWNEEYLLQLENFPGGKFKDMVDASANAFAELELRTQFNLKAML